MSLKLTYLFLLCSYFCVSQEIKISGKVLDNNNLPISYANIILINTQDESNILGTITNESGYFVIEDIPSGTYKIDISFVGYSAYSSELIIDKVLYLKPVILQEASQDELKVIEVHVDDEPNE
ncbi:carboxypeptidase regulatory-like domain-containing protein [Formosa sediminum]|uniref:Carboxypeptidase regulatory-like domain-containing protein n=1 Tax=Formosa sediminum TaxID=2594004 RepID=A0A516GP85_9FLAO|nr:carboxypeptidase-like regulatory domain-containing protein [Formosa sediminum]QDO93170.1 carboxypeptidase regulatory-like domain-containing protein [Formosa sediminum]